MFYGCNDAKQALTYLEKAKDMYTAVADKYGSVKALHYISLCHGSLHEFDKAKDASLNALALHEELKGKGHPDTLVHLLSAADSLSAAGDLDQAEKLYKQALACARSAQEPSNAKLAECNLDLAQVCLKQKHPDDAEQYFKKALVHFDLLSKKEKRSLYDLPTAYAEFLRSNNRISESEQVAHNYLDVYAPAQ
jgi:tetratricopeptide (TPR) repeat protein